jgi:hypothetical protein
MKNWSFVLIGIFFCLQTSAQEKFYVNPNIGLVWNSYSNSNERITGNEKIGNIFWDNDLIIDLLTGYKFDNNLILETGFVYHNAVNRYYLDYPDLVIRGGSTVSLGEGYLSIPINVKYNINTKLNKLKIIPYLGLSYSTHKINSSPYDKNYDILYGEGSTFENPIPEDTTAIIQSHRISKNVILFNYGIALEYQLFENLYFTFSSNFTTGFKTMNRVSVDVFLENQTEKGSIEYKGNKFYISGGIKFPFSIGNRSI